MDTGIYMIHCFANGKKYVGSAIDLRRRFRGHKSDLRRGQHHSGRLQGAWNKYGEEAFDFSCLEVVARKEQLIEREQAWLAALGTADRTIGYNICSISGNTLGFRHTDAIKEIIRRTSTGRKHTAEAKKKCSLANAGRKISAEQKETLRLRNTGRKLTREHIEKVRLANTGRKHTDEARANMQLAQVSRERSAGNLAALAAMHLANTGRKQSPEHIEKKRAALIGHKHTAETKDKISLASKGKPKSDSHKASLCVAQKKRQATIKNSTVICQP